MGAFLKSYCPLNTGWIHPFIKTGLLCKNFHFSSVTVEFLHYLKHAED